MPAKPQIYNRHNGPKAGAMRVDRSSPWGNPFVMLKEEERELVCNQFELYAAWRLTIEQDWLKPLRGRDLICWCVPRRCHAETLLRLANQAA